ncbi:MAG: hypothetical protein IT215_06280 [Chitinophagaceae bacterium]|nr:hypothetical protein [Chitinophagaceae bacterium]
MKKLENLNNPLFEKFKSKKINNLALFTGGTVIATSAQVTQSNPNGTDEFTTGGTTAHQMFYGGAWIHGDICYGYNVVGGSR